VSVIGLKWLVDKFINSLFEFCRLFVPCVVLYRQ